MGISSSALSLFPDVLLGSTASSGIIQVRSHKVAPLISPDLQSICTLLVDTFHFSAACLTVSIYPSEFITISTREISFERSNRSKTFRSSEITPLLYFVRTKLSSLCSEIFIKNCDLPPIFGRQAANIFIFLSSLAFCAF